MQVTCSNSSSTRPISACAFAPNSLEELLAEAARGLLAMLVANPEAVRPRPNQNHRAHRRRAGLFALRLAERAALRLRNRKAPARRIRRAASHENQLTATCRGEPMDSSRHQMDHEVKAITYHGLRVEQTADGWEAEVIVDI